MATTTTQKTTPTGNKASTYLQEVRKEMEKVNWPKRRELMNNTILTLVASLILALFIFFSDRIISFILDLLYQI
jgi:preprotein translocase subunit SecE